VHGEATDLSARLWDERAVLAQLVDDADRSDVVAALFERLRALRLERDVLVHALAARWGAEPSDRHHRSGQREDTPAAGPDALAALAAVAPPPWDLLPPGPLRDDWQRLAVTPRRR